MRGIILASVVVLGCFGPELSSPLSCSPDHHCPPDYACRIDALCHPAGEIRRQLSFSEEIYPIANSWGFVGDNPLLLADLEKTGRPDIAVADSGQLTLLRPSAPPGTYQIAAIYNVGPFAWGVAAGDLNGDGWPDLAVSAGNGIVILLQNAQQLGTFDAQPPLALGLATGECTSGVGIGDFDGDGRRDLVVGIDGGTGPRIRLLRQSAPMSFTTSATLQYSQGFVHDLTVADIDNDGLADVAVAWETFAVVAFGNASGGYRSPPTLLQVDASSITVADFNGDGRLDLMAVRGRVSIVLQRPDVAGTFDSPLTLGVSPWADITAGAPAELEGGGLTDLIILADGQLVGFHNDLVATGLPFFPEIFGLRFGDEKFSRMAAHDLDGDGKGDIVTVGPYPEHALHVLRQK